MKLSLSIFLVFGTLCASAAPLTVLKSNVAIRDFQGQTLGAIVAQKVVREQQQVTFLGLSLNSSTGKSYRITMGHGLDIAPSKILWPNYLCQQLLGTSFEYSKVKYENYGRAEIDSAILLTDGTAVVDPRKTIALENSIKSLTCSTIDFRSGGGTGE